MAENQLTKRIAAVKTADAINAMGGVPVSDYAKQLSEKWARGELSDKQIKDALLAYHKHLADEALTAETGKSMGDLKSKSTPDTTEK